MTFLNVPRMSEKTWSKVFPLINRMVTPKEGYVLGDKFGFSQKVVDFYWDICLAYWYQVLWNRPCHPLREWMMTTIRKMNYGQDIQWDCSKWKIPK